MSKGVQDASSSSSRNAMQHDKGPPSRNPIPTTMPLSHLRDIFGARRISLSRLLLWTRARQSSATYQGNPTQRLSMEHRESPSSPTRTLSIILCTRHARCTIRHLRWGDRCNYSLPRIPPNPHLHPHHCCCHLLHVSKHFDLSFIACKYSNRCSQLRHKRSECSRRRHSMNL